MLRQIKLMAALEARNLFGLNVLRHTHDRSAKGKAVAMALLILLVAALLLLYVGGLAYGLVTLGLGEVVPAYLLFLSSLILFFFGILKAGGYLFSQKGLDALFSLPLKAHAIVAGRFFRLYLEDLAISLAVFLPGLGVYALLVRPGALFYPLALLAALGSPLIPLTLSSLVGAAITALTARMRHKSLAVTALSVLAMAAVLALTSRLAVLDEAAFTPESLRDFSATVLTILGRVYPPALWMGRAVTQGALLPALLWLGVSLGGFALMVILVAPKFQAICRRLSVNSARHDYRLTAQKGSSLVMALCKREAKRYFVSPVYVTNTIVGPIMGLGLAVALFFMDLDALFPPELLSFDVRALLPFLLAWPFCLMPTTSCAVSLEGKDLWISQSLPLSTRDFLLGKLLFNLALDLPFLLLTGGLSALALRAGAAEALWLFLLPGLFTLLTCVLGLFVNLHFPLLNWENETRAVKQSASTMIACFTGMFLPVLGGLAAVLLPGSWVLPALCGLLLILSLSLWRAACRFDLRRL